MKVFSVQQIIALDWKQNCGLTGIFFGQPLNSIVMFQTVPKFCLDFEVKMYRVLIIISLLSISACSVITVNTEDSVKIHRKFGFINVVETPNSDAYVELNFVGIGFVDDDWVMGYKSSNKVVMQDDECTVFINDDTEIDSSVVKYLKMVNCNFIYLHGRNSDE